MVVVVRAWFVSLLIGCVLVACGDDDDDGPSAEPRGGRDSGTRDQPRGDAAPAGDGGASQADPKVVAEYRAVLEEWIVEWDRIAQRSCACFVMIGAYESVEACLKLVAASPNWAECASEALAATDANISQDDARCAIEQLRKRADCIDTSECTAITTMCEGDPGACPVSDVELVNVVLAECPDTGLLSRL